MEKLSFLKNACIIFVMCTGMAIAAPAQAVTTLYSFGYYDGHFPYAGLIQATDGNFYGTTPWGGANGPGTAFKITPAGVLTTLHSFSDVPRGGLIQATDGNFYGTTSGRAENSNFDYGTVFKMTAEGALTTLYTFCTLPICADGSFPYAGLIQASDGNIYGTTSLGGASNAGTIFKITPEGTLTTFYNFCSLPGCADGTKPHAGLIQAADGNLYGTTSSGGADWQGTVFKISPEGVLTTLHSFNWTDGANPYAGLLQATDGNFYGTTTVGGPLPRPHCENGIGCGTVFKITPDGTLTTLHIFNSNDGAHPYSGLIQASDGNFYGTTEFGGVVPTHTVYGCKFGCGTVFQISSAGTFATLHKFDLAEGVWPYAGLMQASDGSLYGTTYAGGGGYGTVFRLDVVPTAFPATVIPASAGFGSWTVGATSWQRTFVLINNHNQALTGIAISTTGDFGASTTCSTVLAAQSKCTISVTFTPTATGTRTGELKVSDSASNSPQTSSLTGTGK